MKSKGMGRCINGITVTRKDFVKAMQDILLLYEFLENFLVAAFYGGGY